MSTDPAMGLPASECIPERDVPPRAAGPRVDLYGAGLYLAWATVAAMADAIGAAPLRPGSGLILALGSAVTVCVLFGLARLPTGDPKARVTLGTAQAALGLAWATLYGWCAAPTLTGSLLGVGMCVSAVALALPTASVSTLGWLMTLAVAASVARPVIGLAGGHADAGEAFTTLVPGLVLAVILAALFAPARYLAVSRARLKNRNSELQAGIEQIRRHAQRDHLTSSYSRQFILEMVEREKARADRSGESLCLCMLDIDHFKDMNDRYGHLAGDRILAAFARRVRGALRTMDTVNSAGLPLDIGGEDEDPPAGRSALGRVGGEEFIVLLPGTSLGGALKCAERVRKAVVRRPFDGIHQVTVSIGIAEYRVGESVSSLIGRADKALYGAKNAGRNRVHCATTDGGPNAIVMPEIFARNGTKGTGP